MYLHFIFANGSNPYVLTDINKMTKWFKNYDFEMIEAKTFLLTERSNERRLTYTNIKECIRQLAIDYDLNTYIDYSYGELAEIQSFFRYFGRKYGLLREFEANGIC